MPPRNPPKQKSRTLTPYEYMEQFGTGMAKGVTDQIGGLATLVSRPKESYEYLRSEFDNLIQNPEKIPQYVKDDVLEQWQKLSSGPAGAGEVFSQYLRLPGKGIPKRDIFIGKKSPSFDTEANELAQKMEKEGKSRTEIWKETGNFRGHDGQWRQEISVKDLTIDVEKLREKDPFKVKPLPQRINAFVQSLKPEGPTKILRDQAEETGASLPVQRLKEIFSPRKKPTRFGLEEIVEAPTLDKAYPGIISEITAERMPDKGKTLGYVQGSLMGLRPFNPFERKNTRFGEETYDPRTTLVHELQHVVQGKEGFGPGGSPEIWGSKDSYMPPGFIEKEYYDALYRSGGDDFDQHIADVEANKRRKLAEAVYGKSEPPAKRDKPKISSEERKKAAELVKKIREDYDPFDLYQRLSGEAEARAAARRADLTPEQRRARFPELDFDIPFSEQLDVRSGLVRPYTSGRLAEYAQGGPVNMYNNAPQAGLAALTASPYADSDVMNVQMTPREVAGLQQLAMSYGAREEDLYDPVTGQPKFSFLKKILPMIAGAILPGIPGVGAFAKTLGFGSQALGSALLVGGVTGLVEGDLKKGLMAGLGAYSGGKIGEAFTAAGTAPAMAPPPTPSLKDTGFNISTSPIDQAASGMPLSAARELPVSSITGRTMVPVQTVTQAPALPLPDVSQAAPPSGFFGTMGQGIKNVFASDATGEAARKAFGDTFSNPISRYATMFGIANALTSEEKPLSVPGADEDTFYVHGGFNPLYGTGAGQPMFLPGKHYKRTKKGVFEYNPYGPIRGAATGGLMQAPDQNMNQQRAIPHQTPQFPYPNQNYPLSTVTQGNYSSNSPQPREVLGGYEVGIDPYTGEERFANGGQVAAGQGPDGRDQVDYVTSPTGILPQQANPFAATTAQQTATTQQQQTLVDPNVEANRKYVEELNRRAKNPTFTPYGSIVGGGFGGIYTGGNPYGPPLDTGGGQTTTGGDSAAQTAAFLATQIGINWMMQPGNALALKNWITGGMKWADRPFLNADKAGTGTGTGTGTDTTNQQNQNQNQQQQNQQQQNQNQNQNQNQQQQNKTGTGTNVASTVGAAAGAYTIGSSILGPAGRVIIQSPIYDAAGKVIGYLGSSGPAALSAAEAAELVKSGTEAVANVGADKLAEASKAIGSQSGISSLLKDKVIPGVATALGAYNTAKAIEAGKEGRAAFNAATTAASAAKLFNIGALGGPAGMAVAAALAAIGASMVNTKEYGDVALRNYWNAVDAGRGIGQTDPNELAQGFINFYRTNKNEFAGQEKYGRTGNEDFVYDMTQVINNAVKDGKVNKDVDAATMYKQVVQPWLNSMGSGPKDEKARSIQDFMMTDLINSFMQGKPISNAQVKGDKKFKIVSEKPVYAGAAPTTQQTQQTQSAGQGFDPQQLAAYLQAQNPYGPTMQFADGGSIGEDYNFGFAGGGMSEYRAGGKLLNGPGDGMSDDIPAVIRGKGVQRAALADGEFVVPADVVSHLGNGSTKAGAKKLYAMMDRVRQARTGSKRQAPAVKTDRLLPA